MEIIIYTDNMQVSFVASLFDRMPEGVTCRGAWTHEQMKDRFPGALLASRGQDMYESKMLSRNIQVFNPIKFKEEVEAARSHPNGIQVHFGLSRHDYEYLLYYFGGYGRRSYNLRGKGQSLPGRFWEGWKDLGMTEEEYIKSGGVTE